MRIFILILEFSFHWGLTHTNPGIFETAYFFTNRPSFRHKISGLGHQNDLFSKPPQDSLKAMLHGTIRNDDF